MKPGAPDLDASCHRDIVSEAQNGDTEAISQLYESAARKVHGFVHAIVGPNHADDVAADTWVRVLQNLHSYRPERGDFHSWVIVMARSQALDHLRRQRRNRTVQLAADEIAHGIASDDTERQAFEHISTAETVAAVTNLPRDQASAVLLCVVIGMDAPTAGRVLHKKPGAIRTAQHRGITNIRTRIHTSPAAG